MPLDRGALGPVINGMLNSRKEQALAKGDMTLYRFIHASTQYTLAGTGTEATIEETLDEWMAAMKLSSVHDGKRGTGLTPLIYAVCAGRADLVHRARAARREHSRQDQEGAPLSLASGSTWTRSTSRARSTTTQR